MSAGRIDFAEIKQAAAGRWGEIITALTPLSSDVLTKGSEDHPCPVCGGSSVLWPDGRDGGVNNHGRVACRLCTNDKPAGDGIATVAAFGEITQGEAAKRVSDHLGLGPGKASKPEPVDIIAEVARVKRMPLEAFRQFEPEAVKVGKPPKPKARVPVYNSKGERHSHFDIGPDDKGKFARGEGMSGMFFPGQLPKPGETWHIVEGVKDASALIGQGFTAAGMPSSQLSDGYARLFSGVNVVFVPDLDNAGQLGAQKTGGRLKGVAASVRVARLPGEVVEKGGDDVRDVLRRTNGPALLKEAIEKAEPWQPRDGDLGGDDGRPEVLVTLAYGWAVDQVTQHLGRLGWSSPWIPEKKRERLKLYQRGGALVHVVTEPDNVKLAGNVTMPAGTARIRPLPTGQIPLRIADACQLLTEKQTRDGDIELVPIPPPRWLNEGVASRGEYGNDVKPLLGIVTAPTIRPDGSVLQQPGYDDKSGLLFKPEGTYPKVPESPTREAAQKAAGELLEVVKDFPFVDDADRSAWLALVLSQVGRAAVSGCVPLFAVTARAPGSGKSLLVDVGSLISFGRTAAKKAYSADDNETRKAITATAIESLPAVLLDNIDVPLGGASLDAAVTATTWSDRVLGSSTTTGELPLRTVWAATGNNLRFASDIARRVLPIRLESPLENPEDRTDIEHPDLLGWVQSNRPRLAVAALTILRGYFVAKCPRQAGGTWGSFEAWSAVVRDSIVWAGLADPMTTRETARDDDHSNAIVRGLIGGLIEVDDPGEGITAREIVEVLEDSDNADRFATMREIAADIATTRGKIDSRRLGNQLRKYRGRVANGWKISSRVGHGGVSRWTAEKVSGGSGGSGGCTSNVPTHVNESLSPIETQERERDTYRDGVKTDPPHPPHPPQPEPDDLFTDEPKPVETSRPCPRCGAKLVIKSPAVNGWQNLDCLTAGCGHVQPVKVERSSEVAR